MFLKKHPAAFIGAIVLALALPVTAWAQTGSDSQAMSMEQALQTAQQYNLSLSSAQIGVNEANNSLVSSEISGEFVTNGINQQNAYAYLTYEQNNTVYQTESAYFAVQDAVYGDQVAEQSVAEAQEAYNMAQVFEQQGVDTDTQVGSAKYNLDLQQSLLTAADAKVDAAYVNFDNTLGLDPTETPDLTSQVAYAPNYIAGVISADQAVADTLNNNYQAAEAKNALLQTQSSLANTRPLTNIEYTSQQAQLTEQETFQSLTSQARAAYLQVSSAQDAYTAAVKAQIAAQSSYSDAQASYNAGVITKDALMQSQLQLASANESLQADLHALLLARANLALISGEGSVSIPISQQ